MVYDYIQETIWVVYWNLKLENFIKGGGKDPEAKQKERRTLISWPDWLYQKCGKNTTTT